MHICIADAVSDRQSAIGNQQSAISNQRSAISNRQSAIWLGTTLPVGDHLLNITVVDIVEDLGDRFTVAEVVVGFF